MASPDERSTVNSGDHAKRPKLQRACDLCRKKKIRCDGMEMPNNRCSKCISYGVDCTYDVINKRPPTKSYVEVLESRLQKMEELVDRLQANGDPSPRHCNPSSSQSSPYTPSEPTAKSTSTTPLAPPTFSATSPAESDDLDPSDDEMEASRQLINKFRKFVVRPPTNLPYHGKSSNLMLIRAAVDMRSEFTGMNPSDAFAPPAEHRHDERWVNVMNFADDLPPHTDFPSPDLMHDLIDSYFENMNIFIPLLHRPTLEKHIQDGLHLTDQSFGAVLLLVCANGCRWFKSSEDPRVEPYMQPYPGAVWFHQVEKARKSIFAPSRLFDLQKCVLMAEYLGWYSSPHHCWSLIGLGLRMAQDIGAHRRKTYSSLSREEGELWKRAFWALLAFDRIVSFSLGRPCALQDEDFDVDPLEECDDEYWSTGNPETDFKQPPGKPSKITFLNTINRLLQILAFASRTIYSINKSKALLGFVGEEWEQRIVSELDSALNKWIDTVPDHLRWDPHRENLTFLNQSAVLYCKYYQHQIFVHRPFLPSLRKSSRLSLPSLAICTNAARSIVHISDVQYKRAGEPAMLNRMALFTAGIVLLLNMWGGKRIGLSNQSAAADVQKCMSMMKQLEAQSRTAGRLCDVLHTLYTAGDFEALDPQNSRKRPRHSDDPGEADSPKHDAFAQGASAPTHAQGGSAPRADSIFVRQQGGSQSASASQPGPSQPSGVREWGAPSNASSPASFDLPVHTEDLGRVPFHHGFSPLPDPASGLPQKPLAGAVPNLHDAQGGSFTGMPSLGEFPAFTAASAYVPGVLDQPIAPQNAADPTGYRNPYARAEPPSTGLGSMFQFSQAAPAPNGGLPPGTRGSQDIGAGIPSLTYEDLALADNTLNIWSSAPTSLDWGDWGAFINNVSGGASGWPPSDFNPGGS